MNVMQKAYKYRIYPTKAQEVTLTQHFGIGRFVYNYIIDRKNEEYKAYKAWQNNPEGEKPKGKSEFDYHKVLTGLKQELDWVGEAASQTLQQEVSHVFHAFNRFYKAVKQRKAKGHKFTNKKGNLLDFPRYKSRKDKQSLSYPQGVKLNTEAATVTIPKLGQVRAILHRDAIRCVLGVQFTGTIKTCTLSKTVTGKYFLCVLVEDGTEEPVPSLPDADNALGIDVGLTHFATLSDGRKIKNPRLFKRSLKRLKRVQRSMARKRNRASINYGKAKMRRALLEERVGNQRKDFLHKLTHNLVCENQATTFCVEDLSVKNMMANHKLARGIADVSWGEFFRQLKYKSLWHGKTVLECGRFEPSSKTCGFCGFRLESLKLDVRKWECPRCGVDHDRDINAAKNIILFSFASLLKIPLHRC